jgi:hypothetical protein
LTFQIISRTMKVLFALRPCDCDPHRTRCTLPFGATLFAPTPWGRAPLKARQIDWGEEMDMNIIERIRALLATRRGVAIGIAAGIIVAGAVVGVLLASGGGGVGSLADAAGITFRGNRPCPPSSLLTWYRDEDGDGFGDPANSVNDCDPPGGYVADGTDCDDNNPDVTEPPTWHPDADGDGFGDPANSVEACEQPEGYVVDDTDCDDTDPNVLHAIPWYPDVDGDGYVDSSGGVEACEQPEGYLPCFDVDCADCDDANPGVHEVTTWYADADGDGFGDQVNPVEACEQPEGYVDNPNDCNDADPSVHDCGRECPPDPLLIWWLDADGDGWGDPANSVEACEQPEGYVDNNVDPYDTDPTRPNADGCTEYWYRDADGDRWVDPDLSNAVVACVQPEGYSQVLCSPDSSGQIECGWDCDDTNPEVQGETLWYPDRDGDGFGTLRFSDDDLRAWILPQLEPIWSCYLPQVAEAEQIGAEYVPLAGDCFDWNAQVYPGAQDYYTEPFRDTMGATEGWQEWQYWDYDCDGTITVSPVVYTSTGNHPTDQMAVCPSAPVSLPIDPMDPDHDYGAEEYCLDPPSPGWLMEPPPSGTSNPTGRYLSSGRCVPESVPVYGECIRWENITSWEDVVPCAPDGTGPVGCLSDIALLFLPQEWSVWLFPTQYQCVQWEIIGWTSECQLSGDEAGECTHITTWRNTCGPYDHWEDCQESWVPEYHEYCTRIEEIAIPVR